MKKIKCFVVILSIIIISVSINIPKAFAQSKEIEGKLSVDKNVLSVAFKSDENVTLGAIRLYISFSDTQIKAKSAKSDIDSVMLFYNNDCKDKVGLTLSCADGIKLDKKYKTVAKITLNRIPKCDVTLQGDLAIDINENALSFKSTNMLKLNGDGEIKSFTVVVENDKGKSEDETNDSPYDISVAAPTENGNSVLVQEKEITIESDNGYPISYGVLIAIIALLLLIIGAYSVYSYGVKKGKNSKLSTVTLKEVENDEKQKSKEAELKYLESVSCNQNYYEDD